MAKITYYNNIAGLSKALKMVPKEASGELRDASAKIADHVADDAAAKAHQQGGVAALIAPTIRAGRDRVPLVKMGSAKKLPSTTRKRTSAHQTIGDVIFGAEFGGQARPSTMQFRPHKGRVGYFLWPTVRDEADYIREEYSQALLDALNKVPK